MQNELKSHICQLIADVFDLPVESVDAHTSPETVESWDSISHLNLVLSLEQTFDVSFALDEIAQLVSVAAIADLVRQNRTG